MFITYYIWDTTLIINQIISLTLLVSVGMIIFNFFKKLNIIIKQLDEIKEMLLKKDE